MSKYYYLIAGLPNIALEDSKLAYSVGDFREEVESMLSAGDKKLVDLFYLKYDNANAVAFVEGSEKEPDPRGRVTREELDAELEKGLDDIRRGEVYSAEEVDRELAEEFGI